MRFYRDENGSIKYQTNDRALGDLGLWLSFDMGFAYDSCLDALRAVDDTLSGRSESGGYEGNDYNVQMNKEFATFSAIYGDGGPPTSCPMAAVKSAVEDYWRFLLTLPPNPNVIREYRPDLPPHLASLLQWEESWNRRHPYRGRLGIPEHGPA
jgi:hypothetical protein